MVLGVPEGIVGTIETRPAARRGWPLSAHLLALCLAVLLPAILLGGLALWQLMSAERVTLEERVSATVDSLSSDVDREILGYWRLAEALASAPSLQEGLFSAFDQRTRQMQGKHDWYVIVHNLEGRQLVNTSTPVNTSLSQVNELEAITPVITTGKANVSDLFYDGDPKTAMVGVRVPVRDNGKIVSVLTVAMPADVMSVLLAKYVGLFHAQVGIADSVGRIIADSGDQSDRVGGKILESAFAQLKSGELTAYSKNASGAPIFRAIRRSRASDWIVRTTVPAAELTALSREEWSQFAILTSVLIGLSAALAALFARRIAIPIQQLARIPDYGRYDALPETGLAEADRVGEALIKSIREVSAGEERLQLALSAAGAGAWDYDFSAKTARWSPEMMGLYGVVGPKLPTREELWADVIEQDRERLRAEAEISLAKGGPFASEFRYRRSDGRTVWISSRGIVEKGRNGQLISARGIDQDITAAKQGQAQREHLLRTTAERLNELQSLYDSAPIGLALLDRDMRIQRINHVLAEMIGHPADKLLAKSVLEIAPCVKETVAPKIAQALETGKPVTDLELSMEKQGGPDGERFWIAQLYPLIVDGTPAGLGVICEEVTEKRRAQLVHAHLAAIVEAAPDAIFSFSADGKLRSWNSGAERMLGYTAAEAVGKPFGFLMRPSPESKESAADLFRRVMGGETITKEGLRLRKDGSSVPVSISTSPMRDANGRIIAVSVMFRDISEQKRREEHTRFIMRELSHRSKNLLAVIQAMARQTGRTSRSLDDFQARFSARVAGLAQSHDLLVKQDWRGVPVTELIEAQIAPFIDRAEDRLLLAGPRLSLKPEAAQNIGLALHELATNASKHGALTSPAGRIEIRWEVEQRNSERRFRMNWREGGGPEVTAPPGHGFGRTVVEGMVGRALDGEAELLWHSGGIEWRLDVPATCIAAEIKGVAQLEALPQSAAYEMQALYRLWVKHTKDGIPPALNAIRLDTVPGSECIFIAKVESEQPPRLRYIEIRSSLKDELEKRAAQSSGQSSESILDLLHTTYRQILSSHRPHYDWAFVEPGGGSSLTCEYLVLPMSEDGTHVSHIVGMVIFPERFDSNN